MPLLVEQDKYIQPQVVQPAAESDGSLSRWLHQCRFFAPFARTHQKWFWYGIFSAFFVVGFRLILPWPLRMVIEPYLQGTLDTTQGWLYWIPSSIHPVVAMGILFVVVLFALGLADLIERLCFARFAIGSVRDLRAQAYRAAIQTDPTQMTTRTGDLVARLIGDTARIKTGIKGLLVHVATNGATFLGVILVLLYLNMSLGLIFALAGLAMIVVTSIGASRVRFLASKFRKKEGKLANSIQRGWQDYEADNKSFEYINRSSGRYEASLTRIQGMTTWATHCILGLAVMACLWVGTQAVSVGQMQAGDILIVMMYALMLRGPIVQLSRQGTRTGKIIACSERLERIINAAHEQQDSNSSFGPLQEQLEFRGVRLKSSRVMGKKKILGPLDLSFSAGKHVALLGASGSGKSLLLELIAGYRVLKRGSMLWDGNHLTSISARKKSQQIAYLQQAPVWLPRSLQDWLYLSESALDDEANKLVCLCGVSRLIRRLPDGLNSKVSSEFLSHGEIKALALIHTIRMSSSVYLLDDPVSTMKSGKARQLMNYMLDSLKDRTIVVAMSRPLELDHFDRVIRLHKGCVVFDGTPQEWRNQSPEYLENHNGKKRSACTG